MKLATKWIAGAASLALMAGTAMAQNYGSEEQMPGTTGSSSQWGNPQSSQGYGNQGYGNQNYSQQRSWNQSRWSNQAGTQNNQFCDAKRLIGQEVNDQQGQQIGHIKDIVFNPQNGEIFAAIGIGNRRNALVPAQVLNVSGSRGNLQVTLNTSRQQLQNAPTVQNNQWLQALNSNPSLAQNVFSHFNVQSPTAMGGFGSGNLGGSSSGFQGQNSQSSDSGSQQ